MTEAAAATETWQSIANQIRGTTISEAREAKIDEETKAAAKMADKEPVAKHWIARMQQSGKHMLNHTPPDIPRFIQDGFRETHLENVTTTPLVFAFRVLLQCNQAWMKSTVERREVDRLPYIFLDTLLATPLLFPTALGAIFGVPLDQRNPASVLDTTSPWARSWLRLRLQIPIGNRKANLSPTSMAVLDADTNLIADYFFRRRVLLAFVNNRPKDYFIKVLRSTTRLAAESLVNASHIFHVTILAELLSTLVRIWFMEDSTDMTRIEAQALLRKRFKHAENSGGVKPTQEKIATFCIYESVYITIAALSVAMHLSNLTVAVGRLDDSAFKEQLTALKREYAEELTKLVTDGKLLLWTKTDMATKIFPVDDDADTATSPTLADSTAVFQARAFGSPSLLRLLYIADVASGHRFFPELEEITDAGLAQLLSPATDALEQANASEAILATGGTQAVASKTGAREAEVENKHDTEPTKPAENKKRTARAKPAPEPTPEDELRVKRKSYKPGGRMKGIEVDIKILEKLLQKDTIGPNKKSKYTANLEKARTKLIKLKASAGRRKERTAAKKNANPSASTQSAAAAYSADLTTDADEAEAPAEEEDEVVVQPPLPETTAPQESDHPALLAKYKPQFQALAALARPPPIPTALPQWSIEPPLDQTPEPAHDLRTVFSQMFIS